jgi:hypothetical protein
MQRERTNRAQVPRTFVRLEQRRARYQSRLGATPQRRGGPAGLVERYRPPAGPKRAADVAARRDQGSVG